MERPGGSKKGARKYVNRGDIFSPLLEEEAQKLGRSTSDRQGSRSDVLDSF